MIKLCARVCVCVLLLSCLLLSDNVARMLRILNRMGVELRGSLLEEGGSKTTTHTIHKFSNAKWSNIRARVRSRVQSIVKSIYRAGSRECEK